MNPLILCGATCVALLPAQPPVRPAARHAQEAVQKRPVLEGSHWFEDSLGVQRTLRFTGGRLQLQFDDKDLPPVDYSLELTEGSWTLAFEFALENGSIHHWRAKVDGDEMIGTDLARRGELHESRSLTARRATPLDGTAWHVHVTPQGTPDSEGGGEPYAEYLRIDRGRAGFRQASFRAFRPANYRLALDQKEPTVEFTLRRSDGETLRFSARILGTTIRGNLEIRTAEGAILETSTVEGIRDRAPRS